MTEKRYLAGISLQAMSHLETLGDNIREARVSRGWSIAEAAQRCLMAKGTYQAIEKASPRTTIGAYLAVLDIMDLSVRLQDVAAPHLDEVGRRNRLLKRRG